MHVYTICMLCMLYSGHIVTQTGSIKSGSLNKTLGFFSCSFACTCVLFFHFSCSCSALFSYILLPFKTVGFYKICFIVKLVAFEICLG